MRKTIGEFGKIIIAVIVAAVTIAFVLGGIWFSKISDATDKTIEDVELNDVQSRAAPVVLCDDQSIVVGSKINVRDLVTAIDADGNYITDFSIECSSKKNFDKETDIFSTSNSSEAGIYTIIITAVDKKSEYNLKTVKKVIFTVDNAIDQHIITTTSVQNGKIKLNSDDKTAFTGAKVYVHATPEAGYKYDGIILKCTENGNPVVKNITAEEPFFVMPDSDVTVTPKFIVASYKIVFDPDGGKCGTVGKTVYYNSEYGELPIVTKEGFAFKGWYTGAAYGTLIVSSSKVTRASNHILTAKWEPLIIELIFDANGGTCKTRSKLLDYNEVVGELPVPERTGYTFVGWKIAADTYLTKDTVSTFKDDIIATAQWKANEYKVTFDANGGVCDTASLVREYNTTYGELPTPTRDGYRFIGWYQSKTELIGKVTNENIVSNDHILYAQWELIS
jgi:uncharacterized repeat protein (TIGR02543 family)